MKVLVTNIEAEINQHLVICLYFYSVHFHNFSLVEKHRRGVMEGKRQNIGGGVGDGCLVSLLG